MYDPKLINEIEQKIFSGDFESALNQIISLFSQGLVGFSFRYGFDQDQAEDIAQEALVHAWRALPKYKPEGKLSSWLFRITANICLDRKRSSARHPLQSLEPVVLSQTLTPAQEYPEKTLSQQELVEKVRQALESLPDRQRMAVILSRYEEMSYQEIAQALDTSEGAIKQLIVRAKIQLEQSLKEFL